MAEKEPSAVIAAPKGRGGNFTSWKAGDLFSARHLNEIPLWLQDQAGGVSGPGQRGLVLAAPLVRQFKVKSVKDDYLICVAWDGAVKSPAEIELAKPPLLRRTIYTATSRVLADGSTLTFTYLTAQRRKASDGTDDEFQVVVPEYVVDDIVYGIQTIHGGMDAKGTDGNQVRWLDLNIDGRAWARDDDQDA